MKLLDWDLMFGRKFVRPKLTHIFITKKGVVIQ
jgi:hypothetical protein